MCVADRQNQAGATWYQTYTLIHNTRTDHRMRYTVTELQSLSVREGKVFRIAFDPTSNIEWEESSLSGEYDCFANHKIRNTIPRAAYLCVLVQINEPNNMDKNNNNKNNK